MDENKKNGITDPDEFTRIYLSVFGEEGSDAVSEPAEKPEKVVLDNTPPEAYHVYARSEDLEEPDSSADDIPAPAAESSSDSGVEEELHFDPRFKLGSRKNYGYSYGGHAVNTGADAQYEYHAESYDELGSSYGGAEYEEHHDVFPVEEEPPKKKSLLGRLNFSKKKKTEESDTELSEFDDSSLSPETKSDIAGFDAIGSQPAGSTDDKSEPLPDEDYDDFYERKSDVYSGSSIDKADYTSSSFKQFLSARFTGLVLKLRGGVQTENTNSTISGDDEDLGQEVSVVYGSKFYGSQLYFLLIRTRLAFILFIIQAYISMGLPAPGMLQSVAVAVAASMAIQLTIMLIALDVFTNGILNAFRGKLGADSVAAFACILTTLDALMVLYANVETHMPLCALSSLSLIGVLYSNMLCARGLRKALRVPAIGKRVYSVTSESGVVSNEATILKSFRGIAGFVRRSEEAPPDEELFQKISPLLLIFILFLTLLVCAVKKNFSGLLYVYSAMLCPAAPFTALLCFAYPYCVASMRIFQSGTALAGWSGTYDIGRSKNLIITDSDIFPNECVSIENVRIFADYDSDKVIAYAGTMIAKSENALADAFQSLMKENELEPLNVDNYEYLSGGGLKGMMEGHVIICGNSDLMRLMDIRIPYRLISNTSVLLAIDGILYGIFNIRYKADPKVRKALVSLMRSSRHPVFAIRDFNITPEMLRDLFDVATDGYDFPPYVERFDLSEVKPSKESKISAVICREGLAPLITLADAGRSVYLVTIINLIICAASVGIGVLLVFFKLIIGGSVALWVILLYILLTSIPILILSRLVLQINN